MIDVNLDENIAFAELFVKSVVGKLLQDNADGKLCAVNATKRKAAR
jgi:hypothetical protein